MPFGEAGRCDRIISAVTVVIEASIIKTASENLGRTSDQVLSIIQLIVVVSF